VTLGLPRPRRRVFPGAEARCTLIHRLAVVHGDTDVSANARDTAWSRVAGVNALGNEALTSRLVEAWNRHDLEGFLDCFDPDHKSSQPFFPDRSFRGRRTCARPF
jgi:hypothetical protein